MGALLDLSALSLCQLAWVQEVANSYATDVDAQEKISHLAIQSPDDAGFELHQGLIRKHNKLWIGNNTAMCTKLISTLDDSIVGDHLGNTTTY